MKKLLMGMVLTAFFLGISVSFGQIVQDEEISPEIEAILNDFAKQIPLDNGCDMSLNELTSIQVASELIRQYGHDKISMRHFSTSEFQNLIDLYSEEMIINLESILDLCLDGKYPDTYMYIPTTMSETMNMFVNYVQNVLTLKQFESVSMNTENDPVRAGIAAMRKHIVSDTYIDMLASNPYIQQEFTMGIILDGKLEDGLIQSDIQFEYDEQGRVDGSISQSDVSLSGFLKFVNTYEAMDLGGEIALDLRMVDGTMYIGLQKIDLVLGESNDPEVQQMLAMGNLFQGKYIEIPFEEAIPGLDVQGLLGERMKMMEGLLKTDMMMTYDMQNGVYMAGMNPQICTSLDGMFGSVGDCLAMVIAQVSSGDLIPMTYVNGVWSILGEDMMPMISRDETALLSVEIPVEEGIAQFEDGNITILFTEDDMIVDIDGTYIDKILAVQGSVYDDEMTTTFDISGTLGLEEYNLSMKLNIVPGEGEECMDCYFDMEFGISGSMVEIDAIDVQAPAAENIVDMGLFL